MTSLFWDSELPKRRSPDTEDTWAAFKGIKN